jgi:hypothetical protein
MSLAVRLGCLCCWLVLCGAMQTELPSPLYHTTVQGSALVSTGNVAFVSGTSSVEGALDVQGTLVLYSEVTLFAAGINMTVSAAAASLESSAALSLSPRAVLTVVVSSPPPTSTSNLTVVIARYASFAGTALFASTVTMADFPYDACVRLVS